MPRRKRAKATRRRKYVRKVRASVVKTKLTGAIRSLESIKEHLAPTPKTRTRRRLTVPKYRKKPLRRGGKFMSPQDLEMFNPEEAGWVG